MWNKTFNFLIESSLSLSLCSSLSPFLLLPLSKGILILILLWPRSMPFTEVWWQWCGGRERQAGPTPAYRRPPFLCIRDSGSVPLNWNGLGIEDKYLC